MKKTKNDEEFKIFKIVGNCTKCGNPIYASKIWDGVTEPLVKRTCECIFYDWWSMPRQVSDWIPTYPWWQPLYGDSGTAPDDYSITYHY